MAITRIKHSIKESIESTGGRGTVSLQRLRAHKLLLLWREKNARKLRKFDVVKAIRELREGKRR